MNGISGQPACTVKHVFDSGSEAYKARSALCRSGVACEPIHRTKDKFWFKSQEVSK